MATINSINIKDTATALSGQTAKADGNKVYNVNLTVEIEISGNGIAKFYWDISNTDNKGELTYSNSNLYMINGISLPDTLDYFVLRLGDTESFNGNIKQTAIILTATYHNFAATYTGNKAILSWDTPSRAIKNGLVNIGKDIIRYTLTDDAAKGYIVDVPVEIYGPSVYFQASMIPRCQKYVNEKNTIISKGIETPLISVYTDVPKIRAVSKDGNNLTLNFELAGCYTSSMDKWNFSVVIAPDNEIPDKSVFNPVNKDKIKSEGDNLYSTTIDVSSCQNLNNYKAYIFTQTTDKIFTNFNITNSNTISLSSPEITVKSQSGSADVSLLLDAAVNSGIIGYTAKIGQSPISIINNACVLANVQQYFGNTVLITPELSNGKTGIAQNVSLFKKGYYYRSDKGGNKYFTYAETETDFTKGTAIYYLNTSCFSSKPATDTVSTGGLLSMSADGIKLTIGNIPTALSRAEYDDWIGKLFAASLTASGYYTIRNIVARNAAFAVSDAEYFQLGIDLNNNKTADILPGHILRVRTSDFMRQPTSGSGDSQGYIQSSELDFYAEFNGSYIYFDKNIEQLIGSWGQTVTADNASMPKTIYGNVIDLFSLNCRTPYMRVVAPTDGYIDSSTPETNVNSSDSTSLYFGNSLDVLNKAKTSPTSNPSVPYMVFRGRVAVSVCISVIFKDSVCIIPAGTTLSDFALRFGITNLSHINFLRRSGYGELVPVFADLNTLGSLPLISGDTIE